MIIENDEQAKYAEMVFGAIIEHMNQLLRRYGTDAHKVGSNMLGLQSIYNDVASSIVDYRNEKKNKASEVSE